MRRRKKWKRKVFFYLTAAVLLSGFLLLRRRLWPVVMELAQTQVTNTTSDLINDAISEQIAQGNIRYDRIVFFEKDLNGRITA